MEDAVIVNVWATDAKKTQIKFVGESVALLVARSTNNRKVAGSRRGLL